MKKSITISLLFVLGLNGFGQSDSLEYKNYHLRKCATPTYENIIDNRIGQNKDLKEGFYYSLGEGNSIGWIQITPEKELRKFYTDDNEYCLLNLKIDYTADAKKIIKQFWDNYEEVYKEEGNCEELDFIDYEISKDTLIIYDNKYVKHNILRFLITDNRLTYI